MTLSSFKQAALGSVFALALVGCATTPPRDEKKDATALSVIPGKGLADKDKKDKKTVSPNDVIPSDLDGAVRQAEAQRKSGDLTAAAHTLSQLVLGAPDDPRVLGEYGKTLVAQGRSDDALAFLERAIELQPGEWSLYSAQGVAYDQKGNYPAAQASYDRALAMKPGEPTVLSNAALSHMQSGDLDGAEKLLLQASPNGAEFPRIAHNLALVQELRAAQAKGPALAAAVPPPVAQPATKTVVATALTPKAIPAANPIPARPPAPAIAKVETATLQAPKQPSGSQAAPVGHPTPILPQVQPTAQTRTLEALKADPTVRMQAVPKDDRAGQKIVAKPAAPRKFADNSKDSKTALLRPALSDADKP